MKPIIAGFPGKYIQGPNVLEQVGRFVAPFGKQAAVLCDEAVLGICGARLEAGLVQGNVAYDILMFQGEVTKSHLDELADRVGTFAHPPALVIALGGGKCLDMAKWLAETLHIRKVLIPTIASTDAPPSHLSIVYDENGACTERAIFHAFNPDIVLVDTDVIINAPHRFLVAGIGDALSKRFEVLLSIKQGQDNFYGGRPPFFLTALVDYLYDTLLRTSANACSDAKQHRLSEDYEACVECTILLSGMTFENGGLCGAHRLHRRLLQGGFGTNLMHGELVSYATLVQAHVDRDPSIDLERLLNLCHQIELPMTLETLGVDPNDAEQFEAFIHILCEVFEKDTPYNTTPGKVKEIVMRIHQRGGE